MAGKAQKHHPSGRSSSLFRQQGSHSHVEATLASSSRATLVTQQKTTPCPLSPSVPAGIAGLSHHQQLVFAKSGAVDVKASAGGRRRSSKAMWMLRSLLVVLLLPYVAALPSARLLDAGRSSSMEPVSARGVSESRHVHNPPEQVESRFAFASAQSGHLDRNRAGAEKVKQRDIDTQSMLGQARQRRDEIFPAVVAVNSNLQNSYDIGSEHTLTIVIEQSNGTESIVAVAPPTKRWGQTATFLPGHNVVLVVGGQTSLAGDITNDVFALNLSDLSASNFSADASQQSWQRLSSDGLPAHAFAAASSVVDPVDGTEKLWIVGGVTQNCAQDAPAYVWSAPAGNITAGNWTAVYPDNGVAPTRRRGAKAITIASDNTTSVMVSGGTYDASTCASTNGTYLGVDIWSQSSSSPSPSPLASPSAETAHVGIDITASTSTSVQSLALDPRMRDFSLTDYTTVTLPANGTCAEKVLFLGGKDQSGNMAPLDHFWVLDTSTSDWEYWNATGLIPSGRMGHTAVVTPEGKVIIHGGYLEDPSLFTTDNDPISEVFILDPSQSPARWEAPVWTSESARPLPIAYHSAVMAGQVMVVSFGKLSDGPAASYSGQTFLAGGIASDSPVHFMDTATMVNAGGMTWSTSTAGVAQARQAIANTARAAAAAASSAPAPVQANPATAQTAPGEAQKAPSASSAPSTTDQKPESAPVQATPAISSSAEPTTEAAAPASVKAPTDAQNSSGPGTGTSSNASGVEPSNSSHTGAIAGSLLGAAAIAAAIGGIYAYRKRKEAAAYNLGRQAGNNDADLARFHSGDEEKADTRGPYVSNLYLRPDELTDVPLGAAAGAGAGAVAGAGWGARLKRAASSLAKPNPRAHAGEEGDRYTSAPKPVVTLRNGAPRAQMMAGEKCDLPNDFITQLANDDSPFVFGDSQSLGRGELLVPTNDVQGGELKLLAHGNGSRASLATVSSIDSNAAASHFSYPYLSAMHREASPRSWQNESDTTKGVQRVRVILGSPEDCYDQIRMSPGDVVSPYHIPLNPYTSPESLFLDFHSERAHADTVLNEDDELNTTVSVDGVSAAPAVDGQVSTPVFPWSTPTIAAPPPAKVHKGRTMSMLRSQPASLHVTNAC